MFKRLLRRLIPESMISTYHLVLARLAAFVYGYPSEKMIVIGVTGTNGKSTTTSFIGQLLEHAGYKVGWLSTATFKIADQEWVNDKKMTMLGRFATQKFLSQMVKAGCQYAVVETSSQGIAQFRHIGINYDAAVLTNLTPEHIEAHGGFENYKNAKRALFRHLTTKRHKILGNKKIPKVIVVNEEVNEAKEFLSARADKKILFTVDADIEVTARGSSFSALGMDMELPIPGRFNAANALAAISVVKELGLTPEQIADGVAHLHGIPGRLETINEGQNFTVIVDYAYEPAALQAIYGAVDLIPHKRLIHLVGSAGGGRDVARRKILGQMAAEHDDIVFVTNEDPYDEDPMQIIHEVADAAMAAGKREGENLFRVLDRREAIERAVAMAQPEDMVLITGKGSEPVMAVAHGQKIPWDDRVEARRALCKLKQ